MINEKIMVLREKLEQMLNSNEDYENIYCVSLELDKLIMDYYRQNNQLIFEKGDNIKNGVALSE